MKKTPVKNPMALYEVDAEKYAKLWKLTKLVSVWHTNSSRVYKGIREKDNLPIILKFTKCRIKAKGEALALEWYNGTGSARILHYDHDGGVSLLEQVLPGYPVIGMFPKRDEEAIRCAVTILKRLHQNPLKDAGKYQTLESYLEPLFISTDLQEAHLEQLRNMARSLLSTQTNPVLLHGDLHHRNILFSGLDDWISIDPRGVVGDVAYEAGAFVCYPLPTVVDFRVYGNLLKRRVALFSELLGIDKYRVRAWSCIFAARKSCIMMHQDKLISLKWLKMAVFLSSV
jgi:streptomycin 6-kinase